MDAQELLKHIFTSTTRIKVMQYFFQHENDEIYMTMIKNELGNNLSTYQKELDNLVRIAFLHEERKSKLRIFKVNTKFVLYGELKAIFSKTVLEYDGLRDVVKKFTGIDYVFVYRRSQKDNGAGQDVLVCVVEEEFNKKAILIRELQRVCSQAFYRYAIEVYHKEIIRNRLNAEDSGMVEMVNADKEMIYSHT